MKATIGRNVLLVAAAVLVSSVSAGFVVGKLVQHDPAQPFQATITYVHSDNLVNLVVHDHNGHSHALTSVPLVDAADMGQIGDDTTYAYWPDYAVSQAAASTSSGILSPGKDASTQAVDGVSGAPGAGVGAVSSSSSTSDTGTSTGAAPSGSASGDTSDNAGASA